jgi:membrane-associated phospholipid phosphatase
MDISILLALQELRHSLPSFIETFFVYYSMIGDGPALVAIVLVVYWCIDKYAGQFAFFAFGMGNFVNQLLKNIVCAYRPWVRDAAIVPSEASIEGATGYSFPSGHTCGTATSLGSFAWLARKNHKAITVICVVAILLMGFSRLFVGVHTPQDVLVGLLIALVAIAVTQALMNWIERYDAMMPGHNKDIVVMVIAIVLSVVSIAIVTLKPYPLDYVEGVLLVDPVTMQKGSFEAAGILVGLSVAWVLERRFVGFETEGLDLRMRIIRCVVGVVIVGITYVATDIVFKALMPYNWAKLFAMMIVVFMAVFVAPLVFNKIENRNR